MNGPVGAVPSRRASLYAPLGWALLRAPLLPAVAELTGREPTVRSALAVASPDLAAALERTSGSARRAARVQLALERYLVRMRTRPTPFGLCAGVALVGWGAATDVAISTAPPRTRTRPDMEWLLSLVEAIEHDDQLRPRLRLRADPTVVISGGRALRVGVDGGEVSVRATTAVRRVLAAARTSVGRETLHRAVAGLPAVTAARVDALIEELWSRGFLFSELRPPLTGADPAEYLLGRLRTMPAAHRMADDLAGVLDLMATTDRLLLADREAAVAGLRHRLGELHPLPSGGSGLQTDLAWPLSGGALSSALAESAAEAAELCLRLRSDPAETPYLEAFRRAFVERYGSRREVPLLRLADRQLGLGLPQPTSVVTPTDRDRLLAQVALESMRDRRIVLELDDRLLGRLAGPSPDPATLPGSLDLAVLVAAESREAVDRGSYLLVVSPFAGSEGAGRGLGRFADLLGEPGRTALADAAAAGDRWLGGRLPVEVVHAPLRSRSANVAVRPAVRAHEVVVGVPPGVPEDCVVPIDELVVGDNGERLYVRWPAADREIAASQTHLLNRALAPPAARLLLDLAGGSRHGFTGFDWGRLASAYPVLPRVQRRRIVLSPARWWLSASDRDRAGGLEAWCARWEVPGNAYLTAGDHRLLLDLAEPQHRRIVEDELARTGGVQLQEALPGVESAWLPGPDGARLVELIVPLVLRGHPPAEGAGVAPTVSRATARADDSPADRTGETDRLRLPGSDWLYLKLYGPGRFQDDLITASMPGFTRSVVQAGLADGWFFVRYADPDPHLRLRLHGSPAGLLGPLLRTACSWAAELVASGTCDRFAMDTYEREVERYGGTTEMAAAERLFCADSVAVATLLGLVRDQQLPDDLLTVAVVSVDDLLDGLGLTAADRLRLYVEAAPLTRAGGEEYRQRKDALRPVLASARPADRLGIADLLAPRRACGARTTDLTVARSHVHMHLNRLLTDGVEEHRVLELLRRTRVGLDRSGEVGASAPG